MHEIFSDEHRVRISLRLLLVKQVRLVESLADLHLVPEKEARYLVDKQFMS